MKRKIMLLICLVLFIVSIACVSASEDVNQTFDDANDLISGADTLSVSQSDDEILGSADNGTFTALQKKIDDACEGAVINLENDYVATDEMWSIGIGKSLTINGNGHTIDGNGECEGRILFIGIDATNVVLKNINFINRESLWGRGAGIYSDSNNLTIDRCNFDNIYAHEDGGAIYSTSDLTVISSNFTNNNAGWGGGAIYFKNGYLTVTESNFINNIGGNTIYSYNGSVDITDSSFINNSEDNYAVCVIGGKITYENLIFTNNPNITFEKFSISLNVYSEEYTVFYPNKAIVNIYSDKNDYFDVYLNDVYYTTIEITENDYRLELENLPPNNYEIKVKFNGDEDYNPAEEYSNFEVKMKTEIVLDIAKDFITTGENQIIQVSLQKNATGNVELYLNDNYYDSLEVNNGKVVFNLTELTANAYKVSVSYSGDSKYISNSTKGEFKVLDQDTFYLYAPEVSTLDYLVIDAYYISANPTGNVLISIDSNDYYVPLIDGHAQLITKLGAGEYEIKATYLDNEEITTVTVREASFTDLQNAIDALDEGETLYLNGDVKRTSIYDEYYWEDYAESEIYINKAITIDGQGYTIDADKKGRIFNINSDNVALKNINFINGFADESEGGAIYSNGDLTFINCSFQDCYASEYHGGAIYSKGNLTVIGSNFTNNGASSNGGAIYSWGNLTVIGSNFTNNKVYSGGGAIYSRINLTVIGSNFINNYAMYNGGAIFSTGTICFIGSNFINNVASSGGASYSTGVLTVVGSNFTNNEAYSGGGAIFSTRDLTVIGSNFTNDNAESGGAIYSTGGLTVIGSNFTNDNAESGGAIYSTGDNCLINNSKFIDNTAVQYGGAIYSSGNLTVIGSNFTNDNAGSDGAIYSTGGLTVIGSNFTNNSAGWSGGAIHSTGVLTVIGSNFTNNSAGWGGGVIYSSGNLTVNSSNFTNNSAERFGGAILSNSVLTVNSSNFTNNAVTGEFDGGGAISSVFSFDLSDSIFIRNSDDGNERTYRDVSKSVLEDKDVVRCNKDYNILRCTLIEKGEPANVYAPDVTKYYGGSERFVVTLKNDYGNPVANADVKIHINGVDYTRTTNSEGIASMALGLPSNVYEVTTTYGDVIVKSKVTIKDTVFAEDFTKMYKNGTQYSGTFIDTLGRTLPANSPVEININGVFYTRYTDDKGVARMNINLNPGTYVLTAKNPATGEMQATKITVIGTIVENHDLTKYYRNASQYSLRLLDGKENPVKAGVDIRLNINGVFYTRTSNDDGYVKMNINLEPGEYTITADYNGLMASNKIKVLSVIETHDLVMKYKDGSKFEAKILDGQGKAYPAQKVTFNINGVFYERITGDDGIARLNINLMAGEYIITTSYNGMNAANKVTISS